jgi:hypothetical protein
MAWNKETLFRHCLSNLLWIMNRIFELLEYNCKCQEHFYNDCWYTRSCLINIHTTAINVSMKLICQGTGPLRRKIIKGQQTESHVHVVPLDQFAPSDHLLHCGNENSIMHCIIKYHNCIIIFMDRSPMAQHVISSNPSKAHRLNLHLIYYRPKWACSVSQSGPDSGKDTSYHGWRSHCQPVPVAKWQVS